MVKVWLVFLRKLALVSHVSSLEVAPSVVQEKSPILTGCTARGLPRTALQVVALMTLRALSPPCDGPSESEEAGGAGSGSGT